MRHYFQIEGDISSPSYNKINSGASVVPAAVNSGSKSDSMEDQCDAERPTYLLEVAEVDAEINASNDPFYDRLPWFQVIGRYGPNPMPLSQHIFLIPCANLPPSFYVIASEFLYGLPSLFSVKSSRFP